MRGPSGEPSRPTPKRFAVDPAGSAYVARITSSIDLAPTESRRDVSQNCVQDVRIIGNTQLVWDS
jgi:hypothetical protein